MFTWKWNGNNYVLRIILLHEISVGTGLVGLRNGDKILNVLFKATPLLHVCQFSIHLIPLNFLGYETRLFFRSIILEEFKLVWVHLNLIYPYLIDGYIQPPILIVNLRFFSQITIIWYSLFLLWYHIFFKFHQKCTY